MLLEDIKSFTLSITKRPINPRKAYNIWAEIYDSGDDNLVFQMEEKILNSLIKNIDLSGKSILDYGCGTGRNWEKLISYKPNKITGCDVSIKMLQQLQSKYPGSEIYLIKNSSEFPVQLGTIDIIFSTLVIAHIKDLRKTFREWNRLLKPGGIILITDLHPAILSAGGKRIFEKDGKSIAIKNYIHSIDKIKILCDAFNWEVAGFEESFISEETKIFYEKKNALNIYERFYGLPLVYGILIRKLNGIN